ncbi:GNAT family N-acetyltransferase [Nocardia sp. NPDC006044]|uniref:GNAT family N-acetyltransferase n=1 Tax=Nocardia sp. NPDC006044 TaxID=3364306 RepID=UPI0036B14991
MCEDITVVTATAAANPACRELLGRLNQIHRLRDSAFTDPKWLAPSVGYDVWLCLLATLEGQAVGFLGGLPARGHISIVGVTGPGNGIGTRLVTAFAEHSRAAGATRLTVTIDSEPSGRWARREFFQRNGFIAQGGSALHSAGPITPPE